jgi:hypothetical protein
LYWLPGLMQGVAEMLKEEEEEGMEVDEEKEEEVEEKRGPVNEKKRAEREVQADGATKKTRMHDRTE